MDILMNQPLFGGPEFWRYVRDSPHHESWDCLLVRKWGTVFIPWIFNQVQYPKISHRWKQNHGTWWFFAGGTFFQAAAGLCNGRQVDTEARSPQLWLGRSKPKRVSDGKLEQPVTREFCATKHVKTLNINVSDIEPRNLTPKSLAYITYIIHKSFCENMVPLNLLVSHHFPHSMAILTSISSDRPISLWLSHFIQAAPSGQPKKGPVQTTTDLRSAAWDSPTAVVSGFWSMDWLENWWD